MSERKASESSVNHLGGIKLSNRSAVPDHIQIARQIEQLIRTQALPPGHKFPPTTELVKLWGSNTSRVQRAMNVLVNGGLLERRPRRGTFVPTSILRPTIGIMAGTDLLPESHQFDRALVFALKARIFDLGFTPRVYDGLGHARSKQHKRSTAELEYDLRHESFLGMAAINGMASRKFPIVKDLPFATFGMPAEEVDVCLHFEDFFRQSMGWLIERKCRKIARFGNFSLESAELRTPAGSFVDGPSFVDLGICLEFAESLNVQKNSPSSQPDSVDRNAYHTMRAVLKDWKKRDFCPDGIIFFDDIEARGAAAALSEAFTDTKIPDLITLATEDSTHFYSLPIARYLFSVSVIAEKLIDLLLARANREVTPSEKTLIPGIISGAYR